MAGFNHDEVEGWTPVRFAIDFVRKMRKNRGINHIPSLRTTQAIPRFLTARYFRKRRLDAQDYIDSAVLNTPFEDQKIAHQIAKEILFPPDSSGALSRAAKAKKAKPKEEEDDDADDGTGVDDILEDLAGLDLSLDDFDSLDDLIDQQEEADAFGAYELFEELSVSQEKDERCLADLLGLFGGAGEMEVRGITTIEKAKSFCEERLGSKAGFLTPVHLVAGCGAGFGKQILRDASNPWEIAAALAGLGDRENFVTYLEELAVNATSRDLGKTILYLKSFPEFVGEEQLDDLLEAALLKIRSLSDLVILQDAAGQWIDPPEELLIRESREDPRRAIEAADRMMHQFGRSLHDQIFFHWLDALEDSPLLPDLVKVYVSSSLYEKALDESYERYVGEFQDIYLNEKSNRTRLIQDAVQVGKSMREQGSVLLSNLAGVLATDILCMTDHRDVFLSTLDDFLKHKVVPVDIERLLKKGAELGVDDDEIFDRLGKAWEQFKKMVADDIRDAERYQSLLRRIKSLPIDEVEELVRQCEATGNQEGMALLMAICMGDAAPLCGDPNFAANSIGFRGIGGGDNLLKQWFCGGQDLSGVLRDRVREFTKSALLELGVEWANRGGGTLEQGLIPRNQVKPFTAGDELENLDIEASLDSVISEGKTIEQIEPGNLYAYETEKGRATALILIDISGSMGGEDLAICAITVVMLLHQLSPPEVAIAFFESDTHEVKSFSDDTELDKLADDILDLKAMGGTCLDTALRWSIREFQEQVSADHKLFFLLSDYGFFESQAELTPLLRELAHTQVSYLSASHSYLDRNMENLFLSELGGEAIRLSRFEELPSLLAEALSNLGN